MMRTSSAVFILILLAGGPAALVACEPAGGRNDPGNHPPFVKAHIPDFSVRTGTVNDTTNARDLWDCFSDPDLPPAGNDSLYFHVVETSFPAMLVGSSLVFGPAPELERLNDTFYVLVMATDHSGSQASMLIKVFVYGGIPPPPFRSDIEIRANDTARVNLSRLFPSPYDDIRNITYVGGASDNLTVDVAADGAAVLTPAIGYVCDEERLQFRMPDENWTSVLADLSVRVRASFETAYCRWDMVQPDPTRKVQLDENAPLTLDVGRAVMCDNASRLVYIWYVDGTGNDGVPDPMFNWTPNFSSAGQHKIRCLIRDGGDCTEMDWDITVRNVNRPPVIEDMWPPYFSNYTYNTKITFRANASDPDGDTLIFHWRDAGRVELRTDAGSNTSQFSTTFVGGRAYIVTLEVEDGLGGSANRTTLVRVSARPEPERTLPMLNPWLLAIPFSIVLILVIASFAAVVLGSRKP